MLLRPQESLAKSEVSGHRGESHSHLCANSSCSMVPDLLFREMTAQAPGECEFDRVRLPQSFGIKGPSHRVNEVAQKQSIELMPSIKRSDEIECIPVDRLKKALDPVWRDAR